MRRQREPPWHPGGTPGREYQRNKINISHSSHSTLFTYRCLGLKLFRMQVVVVLWQVAKCSTHSNGNKSSPSDATRKNSITSDYSGLTDHFLSIEISKLIFQICIYLPKMHFVHFFSPHLIRMCTSPTYRLDVAVLP